MDDHGFEARLRHLEYILYGQQQQQNKSTNEVIIKRMELLRKELSSIYQNNKSIKYFIEKYDTHSKLLNPNTSTYSLERELLSTDVKTELLLAAQDDLKKFAQEVKQVKSLEHVVSGTELEVVDKLKPQLSSMDVIHVNQTKQLNQLTKEISDLMERYNKTVNTVSEIFIAWDNILTSMETHLTTLEHQKQNQ
ncbi:hypothetical protein G6F57_004755 [Rhizopus arrhizus]|uniref:Dynactin subunit 3 n=1 Tax=Rhizopus oryzae TaxID=64495 RepID=A0A9P7BWU6_RHIOR|nr:hypothetical protein G6F23_006199 [Rhizopus arrhizus]KAG1412810.1 hypothetical protein G6F58_007825 [Rhizopus delemar]KAG0767303.1 hypothetical protein G6F24_002897 [Rhizopus arrhizus]KAG0796805.1 hypothetical protein G6F21_001025 [Rhizopus arrhizus]KAG0798389.1 hypothetical protein G6F22_004272 [Rhizopus arrhizus]